MLPCGTVAALLAAQAVAPGQRTVVLGRHEPAGAFRQHNCVLTSHCVSRRQRNQAARCLWWTSASRCPGQRRVRESRSPCRRVNRKLRRRHDCPNRRQCPPVPPAPDGGEVLSGRLESSPPVPPPPTPPPTPPPAPPPAMPPDVVLLVPLCPRSSPKSGVGNDEHHLPRSSRSPAALPHGRDFDSPVFARSRRVERDRRERISESRCSRCSKSPAAGWISHSFTPRLLCETFRDS
jgi:hypothetical protein